VRKSGHWRDWQVYPAATCLASVITVCALKQIMLIIWQARFNQSKGENNR